MGNTFINAFDTLGIERLGFLYLRLNINITAMRYFFLFLLYSSSLFAQDELPIGTSGLVEYTEVVDVTGLSKGELYANAKAWFASSYKSPNVIKSEDAMNGTIKAKSMFKIKSKPGGVDEGGFIYYLLNLDIKEARYKYTITGLKHSDKTDKIGTGGKLERVEPFCGYDVMSAEMWKGIKDQAVAGVKELVEKLKKGMAHVESDKKSDW
ncbi:MAG: hypothetical protein COB85_06270 [Bacteroidetes bacterium]|nr:MAG: hypothetical protein COB85_06270 [Bacteroidota bacterium]